MAILLPYFKPNKEDLNRMTLEEAADADAKNQEIYEKNDHLVNLAKLVAEDIDPTNRHIRNLETRKPPQSILLQVEEIHEQREKENAQDPTQQLLQEVREKDARR